MSVSVSYRWMDGVIGTVEWTLPQVLVAKLHMSFNGVAFLIRKSSVYSSCLDNFPLNVVCHCYSSLLTLDM